MHLPHHYHHEIREATKSCECSMPPGTRDGMATAHASPASHWLSMFVPCHMTQTHTHTHPRQIHASQPSGSRNEVSFESVLIGNIGKTRLGTIVGMFGTPKVNALPLQSVHSFWLNGGAKATASNMWRPSPTILALAKPKMKHGMAKHAL